MMQGVFFGLAGVVGGSYHLAAAGHHGPYRHLAQCSRLAGFFQRKAHQFRIGHRFPFILLQKPADYSMYAVPSPAIRGRCAAGWFPSQHPQTPAHRRFRPAPPCCTANSTACSAAACHLPKGCASCWMAPRNTSSSTTGAAMQWCTKLSARTSHAGQAEMPALCLPAGRSVRSRTQPAAPLFLPFAPWPALPAVRFSAPILS